MVLLLIVCIVVRRKANEYVFVGQNFLYKNKRILKKELRDLQELRNLKPLKIWKKKYGDFHLYHTEDKYGCDSVWVSWGDWAIRIGELK